ncbi:MAG: 2-C-methyl-D-erythritol 4-phosphate cytidylyltransferase [Bacteroidales bacterium]|nr:2-C-methyl-D-erythritol 4-phosphate cytidylyltransferase [Bacteroidales bacterium]
MGERKNIAVILAAGKGARAATDTPKQFLTLGGKLVLERAVDAFEAHPGIDQVAIVAAREETQRVQELIEKNAWKKTNKVIVGGEKRHQSSYAAIQAFSGRPDDNLILHDAARPLVSERIISDVLEALKKYRAVGVAVPVTDTLFFTGPGGDHIIRVPDRSLFQRAQTPQGFRMGIIKRAYGYAMDDGSFTETDDCGVVRRYLYREKIFLVKGEEKNLKITYAEDLEILEKWLLH